MLVRILEKSVITFSLLFLVCTSVFWSFKPFTPLYMLGPIAGVCSALLLAWGLRSSPIVFIVSVLFIAFSHFVLDVSLSFELVFIGILAVCLQAFWCYQMGISDVRSGQWLNRRKVLFWFILRIGPLTALVSATAATILAVLKSQVLTSELGFTFATHWALSLLYSVFLVSLTLFSLGATKVSRGKRIQVFLASLIGILAAILLFKVTQKDLQQQRVSEFVLTEAKVRDNIERRIDLVRGQLQALYALFIASKQVKKEEFEHFSSLVYSRESRTQMLAWAPVISPMHQEKWVENMQQHYGASFSVREPDYISDGKWVNNKSLVPVEHVFPSELKNEFLGVNLAAHLENYMAMKAASDQAEPIATAPLTGVELGLSHAGILVFFPVFNQPQHNPYPTNAQEFAGITGYIVALIDVVDLLRESDISNNNGNVSLFVQDFTNDFATVLYGNAQLGGYRLMTQSNVDVFSRDWQVTLAEAKPWLANKKGWTTWAVLLGITLGALTYQYLILLMAAYSAELKQQVANKTRELILAKESSEKSSEEKSKFLKMLSAELATPIDAIQSFASQLSEHSLDTSAHSKLNNKTGQERQLTENIEVAASQLSHYVEVVKAMSEIQSGQLALNPTKIDLHAFIERAESYFNLGKHSLLKKVNFILHPGVPKYIFADEVRVNQLINHLVYNSTLIFNSTSLRVSVKAHVHQHNSATLFLVITPSDDMKSSRLTDMLIEKEFGSITTTMTIAKEILQQLGGDIKLLPVSDYDYMISASFKTDIYDADRTASNIAPE